MIKGLSAILICTPFTGQTSGRGIIMCYSYEFKIKCVEMYEGGEYPDTPNGVPYSRFIRNIRIWKRMVDLDLSGLVGKLMIWQTMSSHTAHARDIVTIFYITYDYFIWSILLYGEKRLYER